MSNETIPSSDVARSAPEAKPSDGGAKPGLRGWAKGVFILSLTLNILVLGVVAGGVIGHRRNLPPPPVLDRDGAADAFTRGPLSGAFSREDRAEMRRAAEGRGTDCGALRDAIRADFTRFEAALSGASFDAVAARAVLAEMRVRTLRRMDLGEEVMLARLAAMTPEERQAFVERLRRGLQRFEHRLEDGPRGGKTAAP